MGGGGERARHSRRGSRRAGAAAKATGSGGDGGDGLLAVKEAGTRTAPAAGTGLLLEGSIPGQRWSEMPVGEEGSDGECTPTAIQCLGSLGPDIILGAEEEKQAGTEEGRSSSVAESTAASQQLQLGVRKDLRPSLLPIDVRRLPTPARSQGSASAGGATAPFCLEPWGESQQQPPPPSQQPQQWQCPGGGVGATAGADSGGYRERLQARGQQAMRRSANQQQQQPGLLGAGLALAPSAPPPAFSPASAVPPPPTAAAPSLGPPSPANNAPAACPYAMLNAMQQFQQWLGTAGGLQQVGMMPNGSQQASMMPNCSPQSMAMMGGCSPTAALQLPLGATACGPSPMGSPTNSVDLTPAMALGGGQTPFPMGTPLGSACSPSSQELLATVMPHAFCMDNAQIEAQLRAAAADCTYDD